MRHVYDLAIALMAMGIQLGSWKSAKLRQMVVGRKDLFSRLNDFRKANPGPVAWFHVASLGEYEQAKPVIRELKSQHPELLVTVSFFSHSGYEHVIKKSQPHVDYISYLPVDSSANAHRFITILAPKIAFFVKYDLWANHIQAAKDKGVPLFLIAAAFRPQQIYFKNYGGFFRKILSSFDHVFTQQQIPASMIQTLGIQSISVAGDPRYDNVESIRKSPKTFPELAADITKPVLVAGSVWQEDMDLILPFIRRHPEYQYIIAPHDIHSKAIDRWISELPESTIRYSSLVGQSSVNWNTMIIDNIGMLSSLYQFARIAYVGGAFGKGLHNILEPLAFRIPVVFGSLKKIGKFPEWEISQQYGCGFAVHTPTDFEATIERLQEAGPYKNACVAADRLLNENLGSAKKIMEIVNQKTRI